jgi:hypothetical protein
VGEESGLRSSSEVAVVPRLASVTNVLCYVPQRGPMPAVDEDERERLIDIARVSVHLSGDRVDPDAVTAALGVTPTKAWRKGDRVPSKRGGKILRWTGMWSLERESHHVADAIRDLLGVIEPSGSLLQAESAKVGGAISIGIWWDPAARQGGFTVPTDLMIRLASIGALLNVYFPG